MLLLALGLCYSSHFHSPSIDYFYVTVARWVLIRSTATFELCFGHVDIMQPVLKLCQSGGTNRWLRVSAAAVLSGRVPLITFPQRRGQRKKKRRRIIDGLASQTCLGSTLSRFREGLARWTTYFTVCSLSLALSVEHVQPPAAAPTHSVAAATSTGDSSRIANPVIIEPTLFGRVPLTIEEMELIDVRK